MAKRGSVNLGLVSVVIAVVGAAGLGACGSDDDAAAGGGAGGSSGASAGNSGKSGSAGKSGAGNAGAGATAGGGTSSGSGGSSAGGAPVGGSSPGGESPGGAAGSDDGGMGGEGGGGPSPTTPSDALKALSPLPALPADTTNTYADNAAAAVLGQKLFFDKRYSGPLATLPNDAVNPLGAAGAEGKVACATCHLGPAMSDNRDPFKVTLGTNFHTRNAPALVNSSFYTWTNWGGRFSAQWELPLAVAENAVTMNSNRLKLAHFIYDHYKTEYEAVFATTLSADLAPNAANAAHFPANAKPKAAGGVDGPWEAMAADDRAVVNRIIVNYGKALQAYFRKLVSRDAPFDKYIANNGGTLSASARRGAELFVGKAQCTNCHTGPFLTDNKFHNLGVPGADLGRFNDAVALQGSALNSSGAFSDDAVAGAARLAGLTSPMPDSTKAAFRTASLREVADTAPYMHAGQLPTLEAVVQFYVAGGGTVADGTTKDPLLTPVSLDSAEQADLVAFLKKLSGTPISDALLLDTSGQ